MSLAQAIVGLQNTAVYQNSEHSFHQKAIQLITALKQIEQTENLADVGTGKDTDPLVIIDFFLLTIRDGFRANYYNSAFRKAKAELKFMLGEVTLPDLSQSIQDNLAKLKNNWKKRDDPQTQQLAYATVKLLDETFISPDKSTTSISHAFTLKRFLVQHFFFNEKNEDALRREDNYWNSSPYPKISGEKEYLVSRYDQNTHKSRGLDTGNCYGFSRKWAQEYIHQPKKTPDSTKKLLANEAKVTEEIARYQLGWSDETSDNSSEVRIRLGRKRFFSSSSELAEGLLKKATDYPDAPLTVNLDKVDGGGRTCLLYFHKWQSNPLGRQQLWLLRISKPRNFQRLVYPKIFKFFETKQPPIIRSL